MDTQMLTLPAPAPVVEAGPTLADLPAMYQLQRRLDRYAGFEYLDPEAYPKMATALLAEAGEALHAAKARWAWWGRGEYDPEQVQAEVIDLWFFALGMLDVIETVLKPKDADNDSLAAYLLVPVLLDNTEGLTARYGALMGDQDASSDGLFLRLLLRLASDATSMRLEPAATASLFVHLALLTHHVGITGTVVDEELQHAYMAKAIVNLERWLDAGTVPAELRDEALADLAALRDGVIRDEELWS